MPKIIRYFFYIIYKRSLSENQNNPYWAWRIVKLFLFLNLATLWLLIDPVLSKFNWEGISSFIIKGLIIILGIYVILKDVEIKSILQEFNNAKSNLKINIILYSYIGLTILLFIWSLLNFK